MSDSRKAANKCGLNVSEASLVGPELVKLNILKFRWIVFMFKTII